MGINIPYKSVIDPVGGIYVLVGAIGKGATGKGGIMEGLLPKPFTSAREYLIGDSRLEKPLQKGLYPIIGFDQDLVVFDHKDHGPEISRGYWYWFTWGGDNSSEEYEYYMCPSR